MRFWDHDLGPARPRLLAASPIAAGPGGGELLTWTDLTPVPGGALDQAEYDVTPDGSTVVTTWRVDEPNGASRNALVALDVAAGTRDAEPFSTTPATPSTGRSPSPRTAGGSPACAPAGPPPPNPRTTAASWCRSRQRRPGSGPRRRPGLGPLDHRVRLDSRLRDPRRDRRRRRARAALPRRPRRRHRHPADRRPRRVLRPGRRPGRHRVRAAVVGRRPARTGPDRSRRCPGSAAPARRGARAARQPHRGHHHRRRRHAPARLAGAPRRCHRDDPRPAAAVGPRRPAEQLERLALAVEPVDHGRPRLRGAAARPGPVHRVRARLRHPRLGSLGRRAVHRPPGPHRRRRTPPRDRRRADRGHGRVVRRLHGQLAGRPHRPLRRDRHAREPVGARPVRPHHRLRRTTGAGS